MGGLLKLSTPTISAQAWYSPVGVVQVHNSFFVLIICVGKDEIMTYIQSSGGEVLRSLCQETLMITLRGLLFYHWQKSSDIEILGTGLGVPWMEGAKSTETEPISASDKGPLCAVAVREAELCPLLLRTCHRLVPQIL